MTDALTFVESCRDSDGLLVETDESGPSLEAARFGAEIRAMRGTGLTRPELEFASAARTGGAYAMFRGGAPSLGATYYALRLYQLAGVPVPDAGAVVRWVDEALVAGGRIVVDMDDLFYGVRSLIILDARPEPDGAAEIRAFLRACTGDDHGCALLPDGPSDIERTYCSVAIRQWLGTEDDHADAQASAPFVISCDDGFGHIRMRPSRAEWSLASAYWGARTAQLLNLAWPWAELHAAVQRCAQPDGGFSTNPGSTLWETYCALRVMNIAASRQEQPV
ncbi:hypothetical protein NQK81_40850 [Amycolatopsis roodepoortensis]|uniref:prenyltransferase/squalene oxidase repeat-containing protein n=1 Tax=Amycolatopsis roodepoortensis TaxID=700274 RepID=UPI00214AE36C|nr:hypothetical protein [Amycolatopsis roodepoortensis]UUV31038.1 hypothetical protein NQK81_40850 [Amycolatopsis roodepoortensis]